VVALPDRCERRKEKKKKAPPWCSCLACDHRVGKGEKTRRERNGSLFGPGQKRGEKKGKEKRDRARSLLTISFLSFEGGGKKRGGRKEKKGV